MECDFKTNILCEFMTEDKEARQGDVRIGGHNYNERIAGNYVQGNFYTEGGNYNEPIGKNYIQAETVHIYEAACNPEPSKNNGKVTVSQKQLAFAIAGSINEVDQVKLKAILALLQKISGDASIEIIRVEEGSIKIILSGSDEGLEKIKQLFESGEFTEVLDTPVEYVNLTELDEKSRLIRDIIQNQNNIQNLSNADLSGAYLVNVNLISVDLSYANLNGANLRRANLMGANLRDADLSGADLNYANLKRADLRHANLSYAKLRDADLSYAKLSYANLSDANLRRANLRRAYLGGANLSGAYLGGANLSDANLRRANLRRAYLGGAYLRDANLSYVNLSDVVLSYANVENARFGNNVGITESMKYELIKKGAIFEDSPGDRSEILQPR